MTMWIDVMPIGKDEKAFFVQLGGRVAARRRAQNITQVQLAELLDVSQQTVTAYEVGRRRMPLSSLPAIARYLGVSVEELLGNDAAATKKRGPAPLLQQKIERLSRLPKAKQKFVMEILDGVLAQASR